MATEKKPHDAFFYLTLSLTVIISFSAIGICVYDHIVTLSENSDRVNDLMIKLSKNSERITVLENFIRDRLQGSSSLEEEGGERRTNTREEPKEREIRLKRSSDSMTLTLDQLLALRGPPGQAGRDGQNGKDGENCECTFERVIRNQTDILRAVQSMLTQHVSGQAAMISSQGRESSTTGASTYTRWGRTICGNDSSLIYEGFVTSSHFNTHGGTSDYQCLPRHPEFDLTITPSKYYGWLHGAEYESYGPIPTEALNQNVPCALCYSRRSAKIMIPAKRTCPDSWTKEYEGFLMTGSDNHKKSYQMMCMDKSPEYLTGLSPDVNGVPLYFVRPSCPNIGHCPPYSASDLSCVVCTK